MGKLDGRRVLMLIASQKFRDEEYLTPRRILETEGARVTVASSSLAPSTGMLGATVKPDVLLKDVKADDYDAVIFVGGYGAQEYWDNATAHALAKGAAGAGKVTAAICIAPVTLANAGLLAGRPATVWPDCAEQLRSKGARLVTSPVVVDGRLVTGSGPEAAESFGRSLVEAIVGGR